MNIIELLDKLPLWGILVISAVIILFSTEFGFLLGKRAREHVTGKRRIQTAAVVAATMGLLAFVLAFTFGTVTSRNNNYKERLSQLFSVRLLLSSLLCFFTPLE